MTNFLKIVILTILTTLFYWYVGQMVPQKEIHPPENTEIRSDMSADEMVAAGQGIVSGKGTCLLCHTIGSHGNRAPDLAGIGRRAATRKAGYSDVDYIAESLFEPTAYVVEGYNPIMTPVNKPPINLTDSEILAVIAFLQSMGGTPSVTPRTVLSYFAETEKPSPGETAAPTETPGASAAADLGPEEIFNKYTCVACHSLTAPIVLVGPSLHDIGAKRSKGEIYESIIDPDAVITEGFPPGLMGATLTATGFYDQVTYPQLKALVDFLAAKKGE